MNAKYVTEYVLEDLVSKGHTLPADVQRALLHAVGGALELCKPASPSLGKQVGGDHYQMPIQHFDFVTANNIPYGEATAMKYLCRHRSKNKDQDLDKAIHYIMMVRKTVYPSAPPWVNPMA